MPVRKNDASPSHRISLFKGNCVCLFHLIRTLRKRQYRVGIKPISYSGGKQ